MGTNKYFSPYTFKPEQDLIDNLVIEAIQIHGLDVMYLPRNLQKEDLIYGEDVLSKFDDYFDIEMYVKNWEAFEGRGDLFRKWGYEVTDELTLEVSKTRFSEVVNKDIDPPRPREGDLIYFPLNGGLFEIKFVKPETNFYQSGEKYKYEINCRAFVYSQEKVETGIDAIDENIEKVSPAFYVTLGLGSGTYVEKEKVYQGASLAASTFSATVIQYNNPTGTIEIRDRSGEIAIGSDLIGEISGATYSVTAFDDQDIKQDGSAQNKPLQDETADVIDFSEHNPFSEDDY